MCPFIRDLKDIHSEFFDCGYLFTLLHIFDVFICVTSIFLSWKTHVIHNVSSLC